MATEFQSTDPFRSARLLYRAIRTPEDNSLFQAINDDRIGYVNSNAGNIKLPGASDAEDFQKGVADSLLGAVICLLPEDGQLPKTEGEGWGKVMRSNYSPLVSIGQVHLKGLPPHMVHHRSVEIGIDILPEYQGKGYGSEAISWVLDYAFRRAGLHRARIRAFEWNYGAVKLYEKLGFKHEGREREALWHEGRWWDGLEMSILEHEWWEMQDKRKQ